MSSDQFPVFLKLANGKSVYRIDSDRRMVEFQQLGGRWLKHRIEAKILPEMQLIRDLLENEHGNVVRIGEEEFNGMLVR